MNPPVPLTTQQALDKDVAEWQALKEWMTRAKEREAYLRSVIAERMFASVKLPTGAFPEGTRNIRAEGGTHNYAAKLQTQWTREVNEDLIEPTIAEAGLSFAQYKQLIKLNPKLSVTAYRALPENTQRIVDKMLTVKQGSIQLEVNVLPK